MKKVWRKDEKTIYLPKAAPTLINIGEQKFFLIEGKGNPNDKPFSENIELIYGLSYAVRMMPKNGYTPEDYFEYTVYPLEGLWKLSYDLTDNKKLNKDDLIYSIMIRQPDFVTEDMFQKALEIAKKKKPASNFDKIKFVKITDGLSVQMMHIGSYDDEEESFSKMREYIAENNLELGEKTHREIYLSDPRKTEPEKTKTVLRYFVKEN